MYRIPLKQVSWQGYFFWSILACLLIWMDSRGAVQIGRVSLGTLQTYWHRQTELTEENIQLKQQVLMQQQLLNQIQDILSENASLRSLAGYQNRYKVQGQFAHLVDISHDKYHQYIVLDRGSQSGVQVGDMVVDGQGMVGVVLTVHPIQSQVGLITDKQVRVPVVGRRNGFRGIVEGGSDPKKLVFLHIPNTSDLLVGDRFDTSDLGGHFQAGHPVGEITAIKKDDRAPFMEVTLKPLSRLTVGRDFIILKRQ